MTDKTTFVLRWVITRATAKLAKGKTESEVFNKGGFKWTCGVQRRDKDGDTTPDFSLRCGVDHNGPWKCEAEINVYVLHNQGGYAPLTQGRFIFNEKNCLWKNKKEFVSDWSILTDQYYKMNDKVTFEFRINIISAERGKPVYDGAKFDVPTSRSDVILKIGDERLHVSKEFLAVHSPVFEALFFGDLAEKGKKEVELKDVAHEEFLDLLNLIYLKTVDITDSSVVHLLKLADRFQMEHVLNLSKKHLNQSTGLDVMKKLQLADQYSITSLKDHCLNSFTSAADLTVKLKTSPEYTDFSDGVKAALCNKIVELNLQMTDKTYFNLRWIIARATAKLATGKAESEVFNMGGFKWTCAVQRRDKDGDTTPDFSLRCGVDHNGPWKCEARIGVYVRHNQGGYAPLIKGRCIFNEKKCVWKNNTKEYVSCWSILTDKYYKIKDTVTFEFRINITSAQRGKPIADVVQFTAPNPSSAVKIGDEKLHVSKELLKVHSPVIDGFAKKGKDEVEVKNVVRERYRSDNNNNLEVNMINEEKGESNVEPCKFAAPNKINDVILKIGDKKVHVSKEILAIHSSHFKAMFFGDSAEKEMKEVEIKDVVFEEFIDLLHLIYLGPVEITDDNVVYILKLADRFQMEGVLNLSNRHRTQSKGFDAAKELLLADQHGLVSVRDHCLNSFSSLNDLTGALNSAPEFADYSNRMKAAICERIVKLSLQ